METTSLADSLVIENGNRGGRKRWMWKGPCLLQERKPGNTQGKGSARRERGKGKPGGMEVSRRRKWELGGMVLVEPF